MLTKGMEMMIKAMGVDPAMIVKVSEGMLQMAAETKAEQMRIGRVVDAMASHVGLNPRDFDIPSNAPTLEKNNDE